MTDLKACAKQDDWRIEPLQDNQFVSKITYEHIISDDELEKWKQGHAPTCFDDRYFAYWNEEKKGFDIYRSWSGKGVMRVIVDIENNRLIFQLTKVGQEYHRHWREPFTIYNAEEACFAFTNSIFW